MPFLNNLFGKKKKKFKAHCDISKEPVEEGYGYLLTTVQVVSSKKYWDSIMTEPDTMSYTISHFTKNDKMATQIRNMIFEKYSSVEKPWMVSDSYIHLFDIDRSKAKEDAKKWWEAEGDFTPENSGAAEEVMEKEEFHAVKKYAVMEAGKERVG